MVLKTLNVERPAIEPAELKGDPHHLAPLVRSVIRYLKPERILDPTAGSGVVGTIADDLLIPCVSTDLHDPHGPADLFEHDAPGTYDLIVFHPDLWCARHDATNPHDLGAVMTYDAYVELVRDAVVHLADQLSDNGHLLLIAPLARRRGIIHDVARDVQCLVGAPKEPPMIHPHPVCRSRGTMYGKKFIPIAHDNVLLWSKQDLLEDAAGDAGGPETTADAPVTSVDASPAA